MFKIASAIDMAPGRPGLLIPVFTTKTTNVPYVQSMDEYLYIEEFLPFYKIEEYDVVPIDTNLTADVGERGVIVFRRPDNEMFCGNITDVYNFYESNADAMQESALLYLQLTRLVSEHNSKKVEALTRVVQHYFVDPKQRNLWLDTEIKLIQNNDNIWKQINSHKEHKQNEHDIYYDSAAEFDEEFYLNILTNQKHYEATNWEKIWFKLLEARPLDERVVYVAKKWIYYKLSAGESPDAAMNVFCATLDKEVSDDYEDDDFSDFLYEIAVSNIIFSEKFDVPNRYVTYAYRIIKAARDIADYKNLLVQTLANNYFPFQSLVWFAEELIASIRGGSIDDSRGREEILEKIIPKLLRYED